jgi:hypothetical protein
MQAGASRSNIRAAAIASDTQMSGELQPEPELSSSSTAVAAATGGGPAALKQMAALAFEQLQPHEKQRGHPAHVLYTLLQHAPLDAQLWDVLGLTLKVIGEIISPHCCCCAIASSTAGRQAGKCSVAPAGLRCT